MDETTAPAGEISPGESTVAPVIDSSRSSVDAAFDEIEAREASEAEVEAETPQDETAESTQSEGPARGPDGKFISKEAKEPAEEAEAEAETTAEEAKPKEPAEDVGDAPSRFAEEAKAGWKDTPAAVRTEVERAIAEMEQGIEQYKAVASQLDSVDESYMRAIEQSGQSAGDVLNKAIGYETLLQQDIVRGLETIAGMFGHSFHEIAAHVSGQAPNADLAQIEQHTAALTQENQQLKSRLSQYETQQRTQQQESVNAQVSDFFQKHPEAKELEPHMAQLLSSGVVTTLDDAYTAAKRMFGAPEASQPPPEEPPARDVTAQTQKARKSISGAPRAGSNPGSKRPPPSSSREAIDLAFAETGL